MTAMERAREIVRDRFPPSVTHVLFEAIEAAVKEEREACKLIVRQASLVGMRRIPTEEDRAAFKAIGNTCQRIIANIDKRGQE